MSKAAIVIPIYNIQAYLHLSVESAISQTESDIEILLVDDGSTDGSGEKCDAYAQKDPRIRVIHKENGGLSSARNAGIAQVTAPYVLLLDGDDYLHKQAVARLLAVEAAYPCDIVQFQFQEVTTPCPLPNLPEDADVFQTHTAAEAFAKLYEMGGVCASGCTKLFRKELLQRIPFASIRHEDEMWCTRAFSQDLTITYIPDALYGYVMREGSIIHSTFSKRRLDLLQVKDERLKVLQSLGLHEAEKEEWNRYFSALFTLYKDAKAAKDKASQKIVYRCLQEKPILKNAAVQGRMRFFYRLAKLNKKAALELYSWYWRLK